MILSFTCEVSSQISFSKEMLQMKKLKFSNTYSVLEVYYIGVIYLFYHRFYSEIKHVNKKQLLLPYSPSRSVSLYINYNMLTTNTLHISCKININKFLQQ